MDHARSTLSRILNGGEPASYSRFNLAQDAEGDCSHVEVKLSAEGDEDYTSVQNENGSHHVPTTSSRRPYQLHRRACFIILGTLLIFVTGYLIGYVSHRKPATKPVTCQPENVDKVGGVDEGGIGLDEERSKLETNLDWKDIQKLLEQKLSANSFQKKLSEFELENHQAGSAGDEDLGNKVLKIFKDLEMNPWTNEQYIQLQTRNRDSPNRVLFGDDVVSPLGYLAYSATGSKQGRVVYVNYGQPEDFALVRTQKVELKNSVVLLRAGNLSLAQKVANAAQEGVSAVLVYPDPFDYSFFSTTELFGHVHLGSGDPYTPGFPSFNHTQFPPARSSGLPAILAQSISAEVAAGIMKKMTGVTAPEIFKGSLPGVTTYRLGGDDNNTVTVEVNNVDVNRKIFNVFGVIKGFVDPDRYVVLGAQRDSWGPGYAKATLGTTLLVELARAISDMVENERFRPRRSLVFASWSAGDCGNIGATEWLEGYLPSLDRKAFTYISLDGVVTGHEMLKASASPLLFKLLQDTMKEVKSPQGFVGSNTNEETNLYSITGRTNWEQTVLEPLRMEDPVYPFITMSGIPSISFRFVSCGSSEYQYYGTTLDNKENLEVATMNNTNAIAMAAAQLAGQMALRLVHDHIIQLDLQRYTTVLGKHVKNINQRVNMYKQSLEPVLSRALSLQWVSSSFGSYSRAARRLVYDVQNTDLSDSSACRAINDRIMRVEHGFLSPYVSPRDAPFRHILYGSGSHTLPALLEHLTALRKNVPGSDINLFRNQFALATWTIQSCANDLTGDIWAMDNQI